MPAILLDTPLGKRQLMMIPESEFRMRRFLVPMSTNQWRVSERDQSRSGMRILTASPTGEFEVSLTTDGVGSVEIWRAE